LKSISVAKGDVAAGKVVFDANCASCHGAGAKNQGGPGPTLAGTGIKPGQVAFMVRNPAAIDPDSGMPKLTITDKQLADVSAYVASLK
jgi:ubiquinol-cytochrome c reductase cytochrome c subunit